ncbi:MAG: hypothetical protein IPM61_06685 [Chlorobi bacterium]|nr:hypothetical protein [Chlorobiota bacterium]MBX7216719.1 hypothetical protein [Candidatus Kapabacteria bacterium]
MDGEESFCVAIASVAASITISILVSGQVVVISVGGGGGVRGDVADDEPSLHRATP